MTASTTTQQQADGTRLRKIVLDVLVDDVNNGDKHSSALVSKFGMTRNNAKRG